MAKRKPTASEAVAKSREKTGAKPVAITMKPDEIELLDKAAANYGGRKAAVIAGLKALSGHVDWPSELERLARDLRAMQVEKHEPPA